MLSNIRQFGIDMPRLVRENLQSRHDICNDDSLGWYCQISIELDVYFSPHSMKNNTSTQLVTKYEAYFMIHAMHALLHLTSDIYGVMTFINLSQCVTVN